MPAQQRRSALLSSCHVSPSQSRHRQATCVPALPWPPSSLESFRLAKRGGVSWPRTEGGCHSASSLAGTPTRPRPGLLPPPDRTDGRVQQKGAASSAFVMGRAGIEPATLGLRVAGTGLAAPTRCRETVSLSQRILEALVGDWGSLFGPGLPPHR